jgi:hypothetical protein
MPFIIPGNLSIKGNVTIHMDCVEGGAKNVTLHSLDTEAS